MKRDRAAARRLLLRRLLAEREVASQDELVRMLARRGHKVTQTTVSRDLAAIDAERVPRPGRGSRYLLRAGESAPRRLGELTRLLREFVMDIEHSRNIVVLKTPPGAASPVAAAVDRAAPKGVLGTIAGDDTVLVVTRQDDGGAAVAARLTRLMEG